MERNETSNERKKCRKENKIRNRRRDLLAVWSRGLRQQPATHRVAVAFEACGQRGLVACTWRDSNILYRDAQTDLELQ